MARVLCDPPSGWRYNFPKEIPESIRLGPEEDFVAWHIDQGYPQHLIDQGMLKYCRFIILEEDDVNG